MEDFSVLCKGSEYTAISGYNNNILIKCSDSIFKIYENPDDFHSEFKVLNSIKSYPLPKIKLYGDFKGKNYIEVELDFFTAMVLV